MSAIRFTLFTPVVFAPLKLEDCFSQWIITIHFDSATFNLKYLFFTISSVFNSCFHLISGLPGTTIVNQFCFGWLSILHSIKTFQIMKENSVLWQVSTFFFYFSLSPSFYRFEKQAHTVCSPMMIDGLTMSPSIADQNRDKGPVLLPSIKHSISAKIKSSAKIFFVNVSVDYGNRSLTISKVISSGGTSSSNN